MSLDIKKEMREGKKVKMITEAEVKSVDGVVKVALTKEITDRDGDIISVDGMDLSNYQKNPVVLDAHMMNGSVIDTMLGNMKNITKTTDERGIKMITGEIDFAPSPKGQIAKMLVEGGYAKTVSVGFGVNDYNAEMRTITRSELYEVSLVNVPANVEAQVIKSLKGDETVEGKLIKTLKNYDDIKPKIKQYRALIMNDDLCKKLGYEKTGDELVDLKNITDLMFKELEKKEDDNMDTDERNQSDEKQETPENKEENPQDKDDSQASENKDEKKEDDSEEVIEPTTEELQDMVDEAIRKAYL